MVPLHCIWYALFHRVLTPQASFYGHSGVVSLLMRRGCNPNVPNNHQVTALHAGMTIQLLITFIACDNNKVSCVEALVKGGVNMEAKDKKGATPLHYAGETF